MHRLALAATLVICLPAAHAAPAPQKGKSVTLQTPAQIAASLRNESLPASNKLRQVSKRVDVKWGDANIMNGSVGTMSGAICTKGGLPAKPAISRWAADVLRSAVQTTDEQPLTKGPTVSYVPMTRTVASQVAKTIALEGFCYADNSGNIAPVSSDIRRVLKKLGPSEDLMLVRTKGAVQIPMSDSTKNWDVANFIFLNKKTGAFAAFYSREGWI
jgi:hypothetical protein